MSRARYLVGDVFDRLAEIPDGSVDLVMTSPPFLALRSYLPAGHPDKAKEIGQEPSPAEFIDTLLALSAEWRRVLAPHGSIAVELGDTYAGTKSPTDLRHVGDEFDGVSRRDDASSHKYAGAWANPGYGDGFKGGNPGGPGWPLAKSLTGVPTLYAWSLAYGRNLLTGLESPAGMWRIRNVVAWVRPNPPVGALGDKFRPATSYLTIACVSPRRYFDLDAVREPGSPNTHARTAAGVESRPNTTKSGDDARTGGNRSTLAITDDGPGGRPPYDWWEIPTQPYSGSHYATFPEALVVRPIEAMCPRKVCTVCGEPSRRIVEHTRTIGDVKASAGRSQAAQQGGPMSDEWSVERQTLGWSDCGCSDDGSHWRPGLVLDPFAGSGTTLAVATARGRDAIGIDLDSRNVALARERIGMWLVEDDDAGTETDRSSDPLLAVRRPKGA